MTENVVCAVLSLMSRTTESKQAVFAILTSAMWMIQRLACAKCAIVWLLLSKRLNMNYAGERES